MLPFPVIERTEISVNEIEERSSIWIKCIDYWEKEARILLKLSSVCISGHELVLNKLADSRHALSILFEKEILTLKEMARYFSGMIGTTLPLLPGDQASLIDFNIRMTTLQHRFNRIKVELLEQVERSYPITIV